MVASLLLVHTASYEPAVSYILLYLVSSVGIITAAVVVPLLPKEQFTGGFYGLLYVAKSVLPTGLAEDYATEAGGSLLLERVQEELTVRRGAPVAVVLVDPG